MRVTWFLVEPHSIFGIDNPRSEASLNSDRPERP